MDIIIKVHVIWCKYLWSLLRSYYLILRSKPPIQVSILFKFSRLAIYVYPKLWASSLRNSLKTKSFVCNKWFTSRGWDTQRHQRHYDTCWCSYPGYQKDVSYVSLTCYYRFVIFKQISMISGWGFSCVVNLRSCSHDIDYLGYQGPFRPRVKISATLERFFNVQNWQNILFIS